MALAFRLASKTTLSISKQLNISWSLTLWPTQKDIKVTFSCEWYFSLILFSKCHQSFPIPANLRFSTLLFTKMISIYSWHASQMYALPFPFSSSHHDLLVVTYLARLRPHCHHSTDGPIAWMPHSVEVSTVRRYRVRRDGQVPSHSALTSSTRTALCRIALISFHSSRSRTTSSLSRTSRSRWFRTPTPQYLLTSLVDTQLVDRTDILCEPSTPKGRDLLGNGFAASTGTSADSYRGPFE